MKNEVEHHISVVMPVYNRIEFLQEAVESVLHQEYSSYELIIVDDGSTLLELKELLKRYRNHPKVSVFHKQRNGGPGSAINVGALVAKGEYFCRIDSDDMIVADALSVLNEYIKKYPNVSYFYSSRYVIDENSMLVISNWTLPDGIHRSQKFDRDRLLREFHCNHLICWKKRDFLEIGGMKENIKWAEDWELALKMSENYLFQNIYEALYLVREYSGQRLTCSVSEEMKINVVREMLNRAKNRSS